MIRNDKLDILKHIDIIVTQSRHIYESIKNKLKTVVLIYPGVPIQDLNKKKKEIIFFAGGSSTKKEMKNRGIFLLLDSFKIVESKHKQAELCLILRDKTVEWVIRRYIKEIGLKNVRIINKTIINIQEFFKKGKIIASLYHGHSPDMPLSVIEGISASCSVVSSKRGYSELIRKYKCGKTVQLNKDKVADAIISLLSDCAYNKNALKLAKNYFSLDVFLNKYDNIYNK